jgi:hypothetical protein
VSPHGNAALMLCGMQRARLLGVHGCWPLRQRCVRQRQGALSVVVDETSFCAQHTPV